MASEEKVFWIGPLEQKKATDSFRSALRKLGFHGEWISWGEKGFEEKGVEKHLKESAAAVVWTHTPPEVIAKWVTTFRKEGPARTAHLPILVGCDPIKKTWLVELGALAIDDVFLLNEDPDAMAYRAFLRIKSNRDQEAASLLLRDLQVLSARNETIVKQREEFLSVAAHDLRSPIGLIQASLGMVIDQQNGLNPVQVELLSRAKRQAGRALSLVNDLLDVMCFEQGLKPDYRILNLHEVLTSFYQDYRQQAEQKGVGFHYQNSIQEWRILADSDRVQQLLQNLFVNALKFTDAGKNIYLTVEPFYGRRKNDPPYPMVVISVKDEGKGIAPRELQRIFDRFAQLREASRADGRGLGLTVAKQISTLHDGNIWVHSQEGKGSVFHVLFPHVISKVRPEDRDTGTRVLVVEPSKELREKHFQVLESWGYQVAMLKDGVSAVARACFETPGVLLLGTDTGLMGESEVIQTLRGEKSISPFPILKVVPSSTTVQKRDDIFIDGYLELPLTRSAFEKALVQVGKGNLIKAKAA